MPYSWRLRVAPDGTIWLRAYQPFRQGGASDWTVVNHEGVWLGTVELPPGFTAHEFGRSNVLAVWRNELDVEFVRRCAIRRN